MAATDVERLFDGRKLEELPSSRKEAKALGDKFYKTSIPCARGHISARLTHKGNCIECRREDDRKSYRANPEKFRSRRREYYARTSDEFREKNCERSRLWQANNPEKASERSRKWREKNREKYNEQSRRRYAASPENRRESDKKWRLANPEKRSAVVRSWKENNRDKVCAKEHRRRARKQAVGGDHSAADVASIRKMQRDRCAYCKKNLKGKGHVDHILPLSKGGSNWPSNLQLLCAKCNLSKNAKDPVSFAQSIGLLL